MGPKVSVSLPTAPVVDLQFNPTFEILTTPNTKQQRAFALLQNIRL